VPSFFFAYRRIFKTNYQDFVLINSTITDKHIELESACGTSNQMITAHVKADSFAIATICSPINQNWCCNDQCYLYNFSDPDYNQCYPIPLVNKEAHKANVQINMDVNDTIYVWYNPNTPFSSKVYIDAPPPVEDCLPRGYCDSYLLLCFLFGAGALFLFWYAFKETPTEMSDVEEASELENAATEETKAQSDLKRTIARFLDDKKTLDTQEASELEMEEANPNALVTEKKAESDLDRAIALSLESQDKKETIPSSDISDDMMCVICCSAKKNMICLPCRHLYMCEKCAIESRRRDKKCATCRVPYKECVRVYN
jgi:hypothetical protein